MKSGRSRKYNWRARRVSVAGSADNADLPPTGAAAVLFNARRVESTVLTHWLGADVSRSRAPEFDRDFAP